MKFIIGDIAGQADALKRLLDLIKAPDRSVILVGDLIDRGPDSPEVLRIAQTDQRIERVLLGNHEAMMLAHYDKIRGGVAAYGEWLYVDAWTGQHNGGKNTLESYSKLPIERFDDDLDWLTKLWDSGDSFHYSHPSQDSELPTLFVSHAPQKNRQYVKYFIEHQKVHPKILENPAALSNLVWHRGNLQPLPGVVQVFGHNANWGLRPINAQDGPDDNKNQWTAGICIDTSRKEILTALHYPSFEVFDVPYKI